MNNTDWTKEHRQATVGLILFSVNIFQKLIKGLWPFLLIAFFKSGNNDKDQLYFWSAISGLVFIVGNAILSYWFYKFQIINDEFIVRKGYLKRTRLSVPLDRIQTINIKQNILQKALKVVSLEIDTAGAQDTEIKLIAIKEDLAIELKNIFQATIKQNKEKILTPKNNSILNLDFIDLIKVALSENHIRSFFIVVGLVTGLFYQVQDVFEEEANHLAEESYQTLGNLNYNLYFWIVGLILLFSIFISFVRIVFQFYNFKLLKENAAFKLRFGLINTKEVNIPINKIQFISWHQNPLRNLLNYQTLKIKQATSSERIKKKQSIEIPACKLNNRTNIEFEIFGEKELLVSEKHKSHWLFFFRSFLIISTIIITPSIYFLWTEFYYWISISSLEILIGTIAFLAYKRQYFSLSESQIEISKGNISRTIYRLPNFKIQSLCFQQNIFIKKQGLANIIIYTATGEILTIPYISESLALNLYNFLLYKIESTEKPWM